MHWFLLAPIGVEHAPRRLDRAIASYLDARSRATEELGVAVRPELGRQVTAALLRHGLVATLPGMLGPLGRQELWA